MPTIDLIRVKKVFCTPKLSQDKDYGDRPFKSYQKRDRTLRNQFFLFGRSLSTAIRVSFLGNLVHLLVGSDRNKPSILAIFCTVRMLF